MRVQDFLANETERSVHAILRQAKQVPTDKLDWKPMDQGRSVMSQLQECAYLLGLMPKLLETRQLPPFDESGWAEMMRVRGTWDTLEKVEEKLLANGTATVEAIRAFPDGDLELTMQMFGPDPWPMTEVLNLQAWNLHYHTGQICYIQTLLGDKEMH